MAKISTQLMEAGDKSILSVSDVTPEEVFGISFVLSFAQKFDSKIMEEWVVNFLKLRISRLRMGRKELILLGSGIGERNRQSGKTGVADLFAGLGK